jgi:predicted lipoprotein with Yx(FWY)xxD motif
MKRMSAALLAAVILATGAASGLASAAARPEKLQLRKTKVGTILVNSRGFTVYVFTKDSRNHDACVAIRECPSIWPPVTSSGKPAAGAGVKSSLIGTITIKGGKKQATYAGHPLYTYSGDSGPGQTSYVNFSAFGGHWPAVNASGGEVK